MSRYGILWYPLLSTPICPFLPTLLVDLWCRCLSCPHHCLTDWGREPQSTQHTSMSSQRVKCRYGLKKHSPGWWDSAKDCLPTCWELWKAKEPPSNMVPPESKVWVDLWHLLPETLTKQKELMQKKKTHNLPEISKDSWRHSTPRPQR